MKNNFHSINSHLLVLPLNVLKVVGWFLSVRAGFEIGKREEIGHLFLGKKLDRVKDEWDKAERGRRRKCIMKWIRIDNYKLYENSTSSLRGWSGD